MPVNHLKHRNNYFSGDFTYQKGKTKSQVDFVMTDRGGWELIEEFNIIEDNWYVADHKPIELKVIHMDIDSTMLYRRAIELNYDITCTIKRIPRFKRLYDCDKVRNYLLSQREMINTSVSRYIEKNYIENAMVILDEFLQKAHKIPGASLKKRKMISSNFTMDRVNKSFDSYRNMLNTQPGDETN